MLLESTISRRGFAGFFVLGFVLSFCGAAPPLWGHHLGANFAGAGLYFLSLSVGLGASLRYSPRQSPTRRLALGCFLGFAALIYLSIFPPPAPLAWRLPGFSFIGLAMGLLHSGLFFMIGPVTRLGLTGTIHLAALFFGLGCIAAPFLVAASFNVYEPSAILTLVALVPAVSALIYARSGKLQSLDRLHRPQPPPLQVSPSRIFLMVGLIFFHFGSGWSVAGWLAVFLIQRLGFSPANALFTQAFYWFVILVTRVTAQGWFRDGTQGGLLTAAASSVVLGSLLLLAAKNLFGVILGVLLIGFGLGALDPVVLKLIRAQLPSPDPDLLSGSLSLALLCGFLLPSFLGYAAQTWGTASMMLAPIFCVAATVILILTIRLDIKVRG